MNTFESVIGEICNELKGSGYLLDTDVISGYTYAHSDTPLEKPTVAVSLSSLEIKEGAFGGYYGTAAQGMPVSGREAVVALLLSAAVPKVLGGKECSALVERLSSAVLSGEISGSVRSVSAGKIVFDRSIGALVQPVVLTLSCVIGRSETNSGEYYSSAIVKLK